VSGNQTAFNWSEGVAAASDAISRVEENASEEWKEAAIGAVRDVAKRMGLFTTDDVWRVLMDRGVTSPHEPRVMGAMMRNAVQLEICVATLDFRSSERVACHTRPLRVWRSLLNGATPPPMFSA
jgi:hypothetical protein